MIAWLALRGWKLTIHPLPWVGFRPLSPSLISLIAVLSLAREQIDRV